ncbi:3-isopropylmalate dehydratase small subunit [Roseivivax sp. CAU 1753]
MAGWTTHKGQAVAWPRADIDTDQLIPARFMSASRAEGYGQYLMRDLREGDAAFLLDRHPEASVLVTGANFGCGSSREAAVYALVDAGIRVVIADSFADIFAGNAVNNGLLPARVADTDAILAAMGDATARVEVDLDVATLRVNGQPYGFDLPPLWAEKLRNGWDDIDLTRAHVDAIAAFRTARARDAAWAWPRQD